MKIRKELSVKYFEYDEDGLFALIHDELKGRIDYSPEDDMTVLEVDGIKITLEEFWGILSTYEGFEIEMKIKNE